MADQKRHMKEETFIRLFIEHETLLRAYTRCLLPSWDAVDEVMQEASVVMWKKISQLDDPVHFKIWAKMILRYETLRYRRSKGRDRHVFVEEVYDLLAREDLEDDKSAPEELLKFLKICLKKMKPAYQELVLAPYKGSGYVKQLAEQEGRSPGSLYKLLCKLRRQLFECMSDQLIQSGS